MAGVLSQFEGLKKKPILLYRSKTTAPIDSANNRVRASVACHAEALYDDVPHR